MGSVTNQGRLHDQDHTQPSSIIHHFKGFAIDYQIWKTEFKIFIMKKVITV